METLRNLPDFNLLKFHNTISAKQWKLFDAIAKSLPVHNFRPIQKQLEKQLILQHIWDNTNWQYKLLASINAWAQVNKSLFTNMSHMSQFELLRKQVNHSKFLENFGFDFEVAEVLPVVELVGDRLKIDGELLTMEELSDEITKNPKSTKSRKIVRLLFFLFFWIPSAFGATQWWQERTSSLFNLINTTMDGSHSESVNYTDEHLQEDIQSISESSMDFWDNEIDEAWEWKENH